MSSPADKIEFLERELSCKTAELENLSTQLKKEIQDNINALATIEARNKELTVLNQIISYSSLAASLNDFLEFVLEKTLQFLDFDGGGIYLVNKSGKVADLSVYKNLPEPFINAIKSIPVDAPQYKMVLQNKKAAYVDNYEESAPPIFAASGLRTMASVPIFAVDLVIGAINVGSRKKYQLSETQKSILNLIGREIGNSISRLKTQEALRNSENRIKTIVNGSPVILWSVDSDGIIEWVDGKALEPLGLKKEDLIGKPAKSIFPDHSKINNDFDILLQGGSIDTEILQIGNVYHEYSLNPIFDQDGNLVRINGISMDVTDRIAYEIELEKANEELREIDDIKNNFISTISHELKTPLVAIRGYLELILTRDYDKKQVREFAEIALSSSRRLEQIIFELLDISSLQTNTMQFDFERLDLNSLIEHSLKQLAPSAGEKNIEINCCYDSDLPAIMADETKICSVVQNLIDNAIKFSAGTPRISIVTEYDEESGKVAASFADNGIGIESEYLDKIFSRFYQIDSSSTRRYSGSGIGLYLVKEIVEAHGGTVGVTSTPGAGSTFSFTLPVAAELRTEGQQ